jgi:hypothetical protein
VPSLTTRQRVGRGAFGSQRLGGQPPSRRSGLSRPDTPGCLQGAPRAGSGGKLQEGRGSSDGLPDRSVQQSPEAQATPRLSRGAVKPKCGREDQRKRWPWRSGESPEEAESQESIGLSAGRQPRGVRTVRAEQNPVAAEDRVLPDTSEWRNAVSMNGTRVLAPRGARLPERSKALKGEPQERHRPEKGRKPAGGANRRGREKRRGRNSPEVGSSGKVDSSRSCPL